MEWDFPALEATVTLVVSFEGVWFCSDSISPFLIWGTERELRRSFITETRQFMSLWVQITPELLFLSRFSEGMLAGEEPSSVITIKRPQCRHFHQTLQ